MEIINLNLIPTGTRPVVHASQYDNGRQFRANLFEGASVYTLTGAETLTFSVRKPDGHIVTEAVTNTSDNYVVIETTTQMCACAGDSFAELKIEEGDDLIGTLNLILAVEQSPEEGGDPSDSFIHNLEQQIADAVADQYDSNNVIFDAAPTPGHGIPYAVTSEGIDAAIPKDLDDLSDVTTTTPSSGEALVWDGTKWTNGTVSTVGSIDDLNDVDTTGKADGDSLRYDANASEWVAKPVTVALTQAEYDALQLSGDLAPNTHYVITDAPNLNATASNIEYSSGVTVKQAIDTKATIESGSNTNGYYVKYSDGTMICTKQVSRGFQVGDWNAWGSCYESSVADLGTWATTFYATPITSVKTGGAGGWLENVYDTSTTDCGKLRMVRPSMPGGGITYTIDIIGIGRWKA